MKRRFVLQSSAALMVLAQSTLSWATNVFAVRIWPSKDYTRVTLESDMALKASHHFVQDPPRLVVDIEDLTVLSSLSDLVKKLRDDDPFIANMRVAQYSSSVVRLVMDLKQSTAPQVFRLAPISPYEHRLVFDLYPVKAVDPLAQLIAQRNLDKTIPSTASSDPLADLINAKINPATASKGATPSATNSNAAAKSKSNTANKQVDRFFIIAIDPGHGGEDPGAIGPAGTKEKDVVLKLGLKLRDRINVAKVRNYPMRAFMTRDADFFVPLNTRVKKARQVQADLFLSIHADAFTNPEAKGASVYALSTRGASSTAAKWLANKENNADAVGGINLQVQDNQVQLAVLDMSTTAQIQDSIKLGTHMVNKIAQVGSLHKKTVERANFAVLRSPDIPSVLIETAFISNPEEEQKLRDENYLNQLADQIVAALVQYVQTAPISPKRRTV